MGERAILIEFEAQIREDLLYDLLFYKNLLQQKYFKERVEVTNAYNSILILYHFNIEDIYSEVSSIKWILEGANIVKNPAIQIFHIPVCYDLKFGIDLDLISHSKNLTVDEIITLHSSPVYTVFFIGFLPGFLYLGGLDKSLHFSRKSSPRNRVEKGAVGIGENQTGIYPKSSPGGWQIIGNSPIEIFDKNSIPPCPVSPGDKIKFYPVSLAEYEEIKTRVSMGEFQLNSEPYDS